MPAEGNIRVRRKHPAQAWRVDMDLRPEVGAAFGGQCPPYSALYASGSIIPSSTGSSAGEGSGDVGSGGVVPRTRPTS